jgi:hypothetical protein
MRKIVSAFLALPVMAAAVPAFAATQCTSNGNVQPSAQYWDGAIQVYSQSAQCPIQFFRPNDTARSLYRPRLVSGDAPSAFTHFLDNNHAMLITNASTTAQFSGTGSYLNCGIDDRAAFAGPVTGTYSITQTPATVTASDDFVTLEGFINNYAGTAGCKLFFRGIYVRRQPEVQASKFAK